MTPSEWLLGRFDVAHAALANPEGRAHHVVRDEVVGDTVITQPMFELIEEETAEPMQFSARRRPKNPFSWLEGMHR